LAFAGQALAANAPVSDTLSKALASKNLTEVQTLLTKNPQSTDDVIKALLKNTQERIAQDPEFSSQMMSLAGQYAPQITPPSVPSICADLRRVVESIPLDQIGTPTYDKVMEASENFSNAPVVVAQGRPNLCEEALLAQTPGMRAPSIKVQRRPPFDPVLPPEKPSAD
jgi:hypothetical protein